MKNNEWGTEQKMHPHSLFFIRSGIAASAFAVLHS
jgi:hypothetical protein